MTTIEGPDGQKYEITAQVGSSGLRRFGGFVHEEFDPDLRGVRAVRVFDEMRRNEPTVATGLRAIKWVLGQVNWSVQPGGDTPADMEAASFLESAMDDMDHTWSKFIRDALTCLDFGYAFQEITYSLRAGTRGPAFSRYDDGRIDWQCIRLIGHETVYRWEFTPGGQVTGCYQLDFYNYSNDPKAPLTSRGPVLIPMDKAILFRIDDEKENPEGISLLRPCYLAWYSKKMIQEIEAIGIERDLTGVLIIHPPVGATQTDYEKARSLLEQYKADDMTGYIAPQFGPAVHEQWRFEIINSPGSKSIDTDKIVQRYQHEIARAFLVQFLMLGQSSGSRALSSDQRDMFEVALGAILQNLQETINRFLVVPLFRFNDFGTLTALPQIKAGRISKANMEQFAKSLAPLVTAGVLTPGIDLEKWVRQEMDMPELPETDQGQPEETGQDRQPGTQDKPTAKPPAQPAQPEASPAQPAKRQSEPGPTEGDETLAPPAPDDDDAWQQEERDSNQRIGGRYRASMAFAARSYDYAAKLAQHSEGFRQQMADLAKGLREGTVNYSDWAYRSQVAIIQHTLDGYRLGLAEARGVTPNQVKLSVEERRQANEAIVEQLKFFGDFRRDVRGDVQAGEPLTTAVDARATLYGGAVRAASGQARLEVEPERHLIWVRHKEDSCATCIAHDGQSRTAAEWRESGIWPSHGTRCDGRCGCALEASEG